MKLATPLLPLAFAVCLLAQPLPAQNLQEFEKRVTEFTLPNGMHFIVLERHEAPGRLLPHLRQRRLGRRSQRPHRPRPHVRAHGLQRHRNHRQHQLARRESRLSPTSSASTTSSTPNATSSRKADPDKIKTLEAQLHDAIEKADSYVVPNLYPRIIEENGGVGMNASTGEDSTDYFYNFPANRIELWFYLESARFLHPVYREFYKERDVVREERRMRVESDPQGKLMEQMLATAIAAHPYRIMPGGWASDIENLRVKDAEKFFDKYYVPGNITMAIVGDVNPARIRSSGGRVFRAPPQTPAARSRSSPSSPCRKARNAPKSHRPRSPWNSSPTTGPINTIRTIRSSTCSPASFPADAPASCIRTWFATRNSRSTPARSREFPGGKYPSLFFFYLIPGLGHTAAENEKELDTIIAESSKGRKWMKPRSPASRPAPAPA